MSKDTSNIPPGRFCYRIYPLRDGEILSTDISRFGHDLREFPYRPGFKEVLCPYWQRIHYGTVRCLFTENEYLDEEGLGYDQSLALLSAQIGEIAAKQFQRAYDLPDEIKICGINEEQDDPWAYDV